MDNPQHNLELDDLVYSYPDDRAPGFQTLISAKKEFNELASDITETVPRRGKFFKHQILIHRFMLVYDRLLLIHRTGTGKTCAAFAIAEANKRNMKRTYFISPSKDLNTQQKMELVFRCFPDSYQHVAEAVSRRKASNIRTRDLPF